MTFLDLLGTFSESTLLIYNVIQKNGPVTLSEIMDGTGFTRGRLMRLLQPLEETGVIRQQGFTESTGGRRSTLYDAEIDKYFIVGFTIGSVRFSLYIVNMKNQHVISRHFPMPPNIQLADFLKNSRITLQEMLDDAGISYNQLIGLGAGLPGAINRKEGVLFRQYGTYLHSSWLHSPIRQELQSTFQLPTIIDSTIFGDALGQYYYGAGRKSERLMVVACSMSITNGFISKGQSFRSINAYEDALAHMTVDINGNLCSCGNYGCVACYSSAHAIIQNFGSQIKLGASTSIAKELDHITIADITDGAEGGDLLARQIVIHAAQVLGCGLANYVRLLNPDTVILNGLLIDHSPLYCDTVIATTRQRLVFDESHRNIQFILNPSDESMPFSQGGATVFLENLLNPEEQLIPRFDHSNSENHE